MGSNVPILLQGELKMAQYVKKLFDGDRKAIFSFTAKIASTTAETYKVDASNLNARNDGTACTYVNINKMWWSVNNTAVTKPLLIEWDNSGTNPIAWSCNYADDMDFSSIGTLQNTKATNYSGDVMINFSSVTNDDTASIVIEFIKEYDAIS
jgi:hypothetical protein|tara:strand:- start:237 stop:692 length:456 start_codon:yes stop_codon:yes gene_type:complete